MKLKLFVILTSLIFLTSCSTSLNQIESKESSIYQIAEVERCRVTDKNLNVQAGAGESFPTINTLKQGDEVDVIGKINNWYVIQLDNNQVGCINSDSVQPIIKKGEPAALNAPIEQPQQPNQTQPQTNPATQEKAVDRLTTEENQMIQLVNTERKKNNLPPLNVNLDLTRVARIKSQDMVDNNYFSHYSPTYGSPFDMMKSFGIKFLQAGENIAANPSVERAHNGLMGSSGHRQNILNPNYTDIGIGIKPNSRKGYIFTQMFITKKE